MDRPNRSRSPLAHCLAPACLVAILATGLLATGCQHGIHDGKGDRVVARMEGWQLTEAELEEEMHSELFKAEIDHANQMHAAKERRLSFLVDARVITEEAKRQGITPTELMRKEVGEPAELVSEEDLRALYQQYEERIGRPFDEVHDELRKVRVGQKREELKNALLARLRNEAGVEIDLPQPVLPVVAVAGGEQAPARGDAQAPVTIVEFSDFQCPYCRSMREPMEALFEEYPGKLRLVYRHFPLSSHAEAMPAAQASMCANEQGRFWPYHDLLFEHQDALSDEKLRELAGAVGLDLAAFETCLASERYRALVEADLAAGRDAGVQGTPAYFVNGKPVFGAEPIDVFRRLIESELGGKRG
ncbi:MAG: thioredoxin domain-containing protein [Deltaproteobacteria bacterium]|nr:thioredoxin domain-containing protein [Deltaproteobacteria bacterium]